VREVEAACQPGSVRMGVHFGSEESGEVERVEVTWPRGDVGVVEGVEADRILRIEEQK
jgi:hypothetical protein